MARDIGKEGFTTNKLVYVVFAVVLLASQLIQFFVKQFDLNHGFWYKLAILRSVGIKPLIQGVLLWVIISAVSFAYIMWI